MDVLVLFYFLQVHTQEWQSGIAKSFARVSVFVGVVFVLLFCFVLRASTLNSIEAVLT